MPKHNLAARAGHWSARHRKLAIGGWLVLAVAAFVIGNLVGTRTLKDAETGNGSSRVADEAIDRADFPKRADENVIVQARGAGRPQLGPAGSGTRPPAPLATNGSPSKRSAQS